MTWRSVCAQAIGIGIGLSSAACMPPRTRVSGEVAWTRANSVSVADTDELAVSPGEIVRLATDRPLRVVSVVRTPQGEAEVAATMAPKDGVVLVRPALGTTALRVPHGIVAHGGAPRDPEISWFGLETEALAWARSPLGTPFPTLAAAPRIDAAEIAEVDAALLEARRAGSDVARTDSLIGAVRALVALRAVRTLEGVRSYPYARNVDVPFATSGRMRDIEDRPFVEVLPGHSASITIEGPTSLAVWLRVIRGPADVVAEVRVRESGRLRGESRAIAHHLAPEEEQAAGSALTLHATPSAGAEVDPTLAPLRRVFVHVPPGPHTYDVEVAGGPAWIAATDTSPFRRVEDAFSGVNSQRSLVATAKEACTPPGLDGICALALALAGEDAGERFARAMAAAPPKAQRVAPKLAGGAPADRAARLESDAATGDPAALAALANESAATIDVSLRDGWWRGTARGTTWQTLDDGSPPTWFSFLPREAAGSTCAAPPENTNLSAPSEHEIDAQPITVFAVPWRRVRAVRLVAVVPCTSGAEPLQMEVDGQTLSAQPGSARAIWHVVVRGETARIRRVDRGPGHVYALSDDACSGHGTLVHAATALGTTRNLSFPPRTSAPGAEVWVKEGAPAQSFSIASIDGRERLDVVARPGAGGLVAIDEQGTRWRRTATIALPAWTSSGAAATGTAFVALRLVARGPKSELDAKALAHAQPPNVEALVAASRKLLAAKTPGARGAAALERALLLASFGAERAALEDAELAKGYGAPGNPVDLVRRAILPPPPTPLEIGAGAYGIESDFDPHAARCAANGDGPRARIGALDATLRQRSKSAPFDRSLAVQAALLANAAPQDPRADTLATLATTGSKWQLLKEVEGGGGRVPRPHEKDANPVLDADARLRPSLQAGDPFGASFVSVAADRPAKAFIADLGATKARLDIICVPRRPAAVGERCPIVVKVGDVPVPARLGDDGRAAIDLPHGRGRGKGAELAVSLAPSRGDFIALVRIVLDAQLTGTTQVNGVGWVLDTPHIQYRFLVTPGRPIRLRPAAPGLVRIDAVPEPGETVEVVVSVGGRAVRVPTSGETRIIPLATAGDVVVTARGGIATVAIAERLEAESKSPEGELDRDASVRRVDSTSARVALANGAWRDVAERSPRPLTWLEDRLGTIESLTGGLARTIREGATSDTAPDAFATESLTYRRRIESLKLFTLVSGLVRVRDGNPTYGGSLSFYEDLSVARLRVSGTLGAFAQDVGTDKEFTLRPRGFVEYSGRLTSDLFLLPRVGYDGYHTTLTDRPGSSRNVDDDLYNAFRFQRNSFAFAQGLLVYVPFFNELFYLRGRGTCDLTNGAFSHAAIRPGTDVIFHALEIGAYGEGQYFERTTGARTRSGVDLAAGLGVNVHLPLAPGSFEIRPSSNAQIRADGGWQIFAGIAILASYRRGARDYSSLELAFPEETSGGIPWRTESKGQ